MTTRRMAVDEVCQKLVEAGVEGAARDARVLMAHVLDLQVLDIVTDADAELSAGELAQFEAVIAARGARQPVSQIIGLRAFWKHEFYVTEDVLDPRPETEQLLETALIGRAPERVLDLGTGSGCIAISLLLAWPHAVGFGTDISPKALNVAQKNAQMHGVEERLELSQTDWFEHVQGRFDLIVCNPPYIAETEMAELAPEVRDWEPHLALTPGKDGLSAYRLILADLRKHLAPGGRALFEAGVTQVPELIAISKSNGFANTESYRDLTNRERGILIQT